MKQFQIKGQVFIHLLTDRYYNEYMFKHFYIYDEDDNGIGMYLKGKKKFKTQGTISL